MDEFSSRHYPFQEHMRFQRASWVVERIGWLVLGAIALLALTGLFGSGYLSAGAAHGDTLSVEFDRFERVTRLSAFHFRFAAGAAGERRLRLNGAFRDGYEITGFQPAPLRMEADGDGLAMTFALPAGGGDIKLWAHARRYGSARLEVRADDGAPLAFSVFVYP